MAVTPQTTQIARRGAPAEFSALAVNGENVSAGAENQTLTASGAITINSGLVQLNHASVAIAATLDAPTVGDRLIIADMSASGTAAHTVTLPSGVTWDGTNRVLTLNAPGEFVHVIATSATRFLVLASGGTPTFS